MKFKSDIEVQAGLKDSSGAAGTSGQVLSSTASGVSWVSQSGFVPYTGATGDVDLGIHQLKADSLAVSTSSLEPVDVGEIVWNQIDGTFDMGLIGGVTLQAGQEMHVYGKATQAISNGDAVMFSGVQGDHILIAKADAATINANPEYFIGIATQNFATNDFGYVTIFGNVRGLNTTAYTLGTVLYYDSTTATDGLLTPTEPTAPNAKIEVAAVVRVHATQGILLVRPHVMPKLNDIQDIFAPNPFNNDVLFWNGFSSRYETETIPGILGYNPVPPSRTITINGVTQDLSVDRTFNINTGVTSFNTRTGAVTLTSTDVNTALGYTAANDANVVKLTGDQTIGGIKSFTLNNGAGDNFTFRINHFTSGGGITSAITPLEVINNNNPSTPFFKLDNAGSLTANSFVKIGGNSTQYLKADGSVSTAMNSRIEVNFVATAGQTTFTTPYEVGQIDVYYNGSKLYPNEFTATNGTTVILAQAATLNAQISIVKYVAALSTSAIRNETTFTTTAGQTTFSVNYTVGQLDVFYNGSKLNISEFTATDGTSVVLGFSCAAGESVVFVSYVNQVSGASGTPNYVSKFTGAASLGDSQIFDNGSNVVIGGSAGIAKLTVVGTMFGGSMFFNNGNISTAGSTFISLSTNSLERLRVNTNGNVLIGTTTDAGFRLDVNGTGRFSGDLLVKRNATGGFLSSWGVVAMGQSAALVGPPDANAILCANAYFDGTWKRMNTGVANILEMTVGGTNVQFFTSPSNVPGSSANFIAGPFIANSGVSWTNGSSDVRQKKNFEPSQGLKEVLQIEAVKYHFNWDDDSSVKRLGFKAQNLQTIIPEMVSEQSKLADDGTPLLTITPDYLLPVLVKAIQEQNAMIQELKAEIEILKNK